MFSFYNSRLLCTFDKKVVKTQKHIFMSNSSYCSPDPKVIATVGGAGGKNYRTPLKMLFCFLTYADII